MRHAISFRLNGEARTLDVEPWEVLLDVLRERLGIKSPKVGCEMGECGACTVLLDGRTVRSCLVLAVEADGHEIVTVEGLGAEGLTALQSAFLKHHSFQCGFCAPGVVLSAAELLARNPHPSEWETRMALTGNLCRCTGYLPILDGIREAAEGGDQ